jgi:hypothetical protein
MKIVSNNKRRPGLGPTDAAGYWHCDVPVDDDVIDWLVGIGRLPWPNRADPFAIGQAISKLLHEMAEVTLAMPEGATPDEIMQECGRVLRLRRCDHQ